MFFNIKINIAFFYIVTTIAYIFLFNYLYEELKFSLIVSTMTVTILIALSTFMISKLSTEPLIRYIRHLQELSGQTLHELNLPIATIKTNLSMLQKKAEDEKTRKRLRRIEEATAMLQERYDELDYLIKTQTMKRIRERFNIKELIQKRIDFLRNIYPSNEFLLELEDGEITGDPFGLAKTIDNLIDNAVKYSSKHSKIIVKFTNDTLSIKDEGKGIDEVELIRIFDSYYQEDSSSKGFGIGLAMVKRFCDTNEIDLCIHSKIGVGTTIELKFKG